MATVFERVKKVVVEQLGVEDKEVVPMASFVDDLGADSLDLDPGLLRFSPEIPGRTTEGLLLRALGKRYRHLQSQGSTPGQALH